MLTRAGDPPSDEAMVPNPTNTNYGDAVFQAARARTSTLLEDLGYNLSTLVEGDVVARLRHWVRGRASTGTAGSLGSDVGGPSPPRAPTEAPHSPCTPQIDGSAVHYYTLLADHFSYVTRVFCCCIRLLLLLQLLMLLLLLLFCLPWNCCHVAEVCFPICSLAGTAGMSALCLFGLFAGRRFGDMCVCVCSVQTPPCSTSPAVQESFSPIFAMLYYKWLFRDPFVWSDVVADRFG